MKEPKCSVCRPSPNARIRPFSLTSKTFLRSGKIEFNNGSLLFTDGWGSSSVAADTVTAVEHRYRRIPFGYSGGSYDILAGELVCVRSDGTVAATLPGGWVGNPHILEDGKSQVLPGWWEYAEVLEVLSQAGVPLREVGADEGAAPAFSLLVQFFGNRPLPPNSFHTIRALLAWCAPMMLLMMLVLVASV